MSNRFLVFLMALTVTSIVSAEAILLDATFDGGYGVMSPQKDIYTDRSELQAIHDGFSTHARKENGPVWRLVQWGSEKSLANIAAKPYATGGKQWQLFEKKEDRSLLYKNIALEPGGVLTLELNGLAEFSTSLHQKKEDKSLYLNSLDQYWPHLLMAQNIQSKKLHEYQEVRLSLDAKLLFDHKNLSEGYQPGIHAARFPIAIAVRNTLSGNMFWLSLVIYDDRYSKSGFICQKCVMNKDRKENCRIPDKLDDGGRWECPFDGNRWSIDAEKKGTRKMIFRIPTEAFTEDNIHNGGWVRCQINLIPYIQAGIEAARETKKLRGFSPDLRFYELSFFSMGWEMTGLNHAAIAVKNLSLTGL